MAAGLTNIAAAERGFLPLWRRGHEGPPRGLDCAGAASIRQIPQVRLIQIDHANVASVAQYDDPAARGASTICWRADDRGRYVWVNVGVETASEELLRRSARRGRCGRRESEPWGDFCARQLRRLCRARFFPMASLVIGLPGESDEHLQETLAWVESLATERLAIFPVLYAPRRRHAAPRSARACGPCTGH